MDLRPKKKKLFLTLEGGEGSGKTTMLQHLGQYLEDAGCDVVKTREPGGSFLGEKVRQLLLSPELKNKISARAELLLFLAARAQHVEEVIQPALQEGKVVLCDRFHDSTIAYQGMARGLGFSSVEQLCLFSCQGLHPDITLYLDTPPILGLQRAAQAAGKEYMPDRMESEALIFHECVRRGFLLLCERYPQRIFRIDATLPLEEVFAQAVAIIDEIFLKVQEV